MKDWLTSLTLAFILLPLANAVADGPATGPDEARLGQARFNLAVFSPNGEQVLTNEQTDDPHGGEAAALWDVKTGRLVRRFIGHKGIVDAGAFTPDGKQIVTGGGSARGDLPGPANAELRLWDLASGREIRQYPGHNRPVISVYFSPDGNRILSVGFLEVARLWDVQSGRQLFVWPKEGGEGVHNGELSKDGRLALTQDSGGFTIWNGSSGKEVVSVDLPRVYVSAAHFSPDAKLVATADFNNSVRTWGSTTGKQVQLFEGHTSYVFQSRFSADGKWLATAANDKTARIWDVATGKEIRSFSHAGPCVRDVRFNADSTRLVTAWLCEQAGLLRENYLAGMSLWDAQSGKELRRISTRNDQFTPGRMVFTPDGKALLVCLEKTELIDCETGKTIREYK